jgi:hypothetical protein
MEIYRTSLRRQYDVLHMYMKVHAVTRSRTTMYLHLPKSVALLSIERGAERRGKNSNQNSISII